MSCCLRNKFLIFLGLIFLAPFFSEAASLKMMSDTISTSEPGRNAGHVIEFVNTNEIPAGGQINIGFQGKISPFIFPQLFDFSNLDFSVDRGVGYEEYMLDEVHDAATSSMMLVPNHDGEIQIRVAYDGQYAIPPNSRLRIRVGGGVAAPQSIINPPNEGAHRILINTFDPSLVPIDEGKTMIFTMWPISFNTAVKGLAPLITNGLPKGLLPGGTKKVFVSAETNIPSYCRYSYTPNVLYDNMPNSNLMKYSNFNRLHYVILDVEDDKAYTLYLRCFSKYGLEANQVDYPINFEIGIIPSESNPPPPPAGTQAGNNSGGGNMLPQSGLTIEGKTFPAANVVILKDGKEFQTIVSDQQGSFNATVSDIDRGTYSFTMISTSDKARSTQYNTTLYVSGSTRNSIGPVYLSPTVTSKTDKIDLGSQAQVFGKAVPLLDVQVIVVGPKDPLQQPYVVNKTTANGSGDWNLTLDTSKLPKGTYSVLAQTIVPGQGNSQFSEGYYIGIGVKPDGNNKRKADLNNDGRVNIADLSILLFNWKKSSPIADINIDGTVNITDFSIMLSNWTA